MDLRDEILTDREQYPDDTTITLQNGKTITVKEFRDGYLPKGEMTRMSEGWRRKEEQLTEAYRGSQQQALVLQQQAEALQRQLEAAANARGVVPPNGGEVPEEDLSRDPVLGPMYRKLQKALEVQDASQKRLDAHETQLRNHASTWQRAGFQSQLDRIKARPDAKDLDVNAFLAHAQRKPVLDMETNLVDLEATYRIYNADKLEKAAEDRGYARGEEKGKAAASVPRIPGGRRRSSSRPEGLPANLQSLDTDTVLNDPEIQQAMQADGLLG